MAATTKRILVRVTPAQKREIECQAARLGLSVSELMCQVAMDVAASPEPQAIEALLEQVKQSTKAASDALDEMLRGSPIA
jgi:uncharacterized protein (DUF1778 family)